MVKCPVCLTEQSPASNCRTCGAPMPEATADTANPYAAPIVGGPLAEAVPRYQAPLARRFARLAAQFLDGLINLVALIPGVALLIAATNAPPKNGEVPILAFVVMAIGFLCLNIYQWILLSRDGQTLGKKALGIKVVMYDDGSNPGFGRTVALRVWVNGLIGAVPYIGGIYGLIDALFIFGEERRCIHDYMAGTKVIEVS